MITRGLIERIHQGAYIRRWNDHIHPEQGFSELDKQAHKMAIAFFLAKIEEKVSEKMIDYQKLIEGGISQYFHRVELTDIKPPIFHRLMESKGEALNTYVIKQCEKDLFLLGDNTFLTRFQDHLAEDLKQIEQLSLEHKILAAAHYLATKWEFDLIHEANKNLYGFYETEQEIEKKLASYHGMSSVSYAITNVRYKHLFDLIGQLRFQRRWTQTVRIPETSVMGHSLVVAILAYLISLELKLDIHTQAVHHFWLGLFHDIPEVLTRDIISPVKQSVSDLEKLIKEIEQDEINKKLKSLFEVSEKDKAIGQDFFWYVETEFSLTKHPESNTEILGPMIKNCDRYAAYVEASLSLSHGIISKQLIDARRRIEEFFSDTTREELFPELTQKYSKNQFSWRLLLDYFA